MVEYCSNATINTCLNYIIPRNFNWTHGLGLSAATGALGYFFGFGRDDSKNAASYWAPIAAAGATGMAATKLLWSSAHTKQVTKLEKVFVPKFLKPIVRK